MKKIYFTLVVIFSFLYSCQNQSEKDKVLAKVGSFTITEKYFNEKIQELNQGDNSFLNSKTGKKQFLDMLINEKLVKILSENSGLKNSKEYRDQVEMMNREMENKLKEFKEYLLTKMWLEDLKKKELNVSEKDIEDYYSKYPKTVNIEHIICDNYETAEKILKKIKSGISVSKILEENKNNPSITGGKLPPIFPGEFLPEIEDMLYKMKVGEIQGVVKTKLGFHIIKKVGESVQDLKKSDVKDKIKRILEKKKFDEYMDKVQKKYKVEVIDENYK